MNKQSSLLKIFHECQSCRRCPLFESRTNVVFSKGSPDADIFFVGEAPGEKEDLSGEPFVGASGKLLDKFLAEAGIDKENVYVANVLKCRPPKNRDPLPAEEDACIDYLFSQIDTVNPKIIVCLGRIAAKRLIKKDFKITDEHGIVFEKDGLKISAVYHPAAVLRDVKKREEVMCDLKKIQEMINSLKN